VPYLLRSPTDKTSEQLIFETCDEMEETAKDCLHFNKEPEFRLKCEEHIANIHQMMLSLKVVYQHLFDSADADCNECLNRFYGKFNPEDAREYTTTIRKGFKPKERKGKQKDAILGNTEMSNYLCTVSTRAHLAIQFARQLRALMLEAGMTKSIPRRKSMSA
jgi:hypothetical protein